MDIRSGKVESQHPWEAQKSLKLARLDLENLPEYDEIRLLLTGQDFMPEVPSVAARLS